MPELIDKYTSRKEIAGLKTRAFKFWGVALALISFWVFLILLAPVAEASELISVSNPVYGFYSYICHQIPSRSFHMLEHQFAVCSRCFGVYFGLLIGIVSYPLLRSMEEIEPLPRFWLILAIIPMAIDWSLTIFGVWENTHLSRVTTGLILGIACAVFIVPALVELSQMLLLKEGQKPKSA